MTDASTPDGTLDLAGGTDISVESLMSAFVTAPEMDVVQAPTQADLIDEYAPTEGRIGITADNTVHIADGTTWDSVSNRSAISGTTGPRIKALQFGVSSGDITLMARSDKQLGTLDVDYTSPSGPASLSLTDFQENPTQNGYAYFALLTVSPSEGDTLTAETTLVEDTAGNAAGVTYKTSLTVPDLTAPTVNTFSVTEPTAGTARVTVEVDEQLSALALEQISPTSDEIVLSDFTETAVTGGYKYVYEDTSGTSGETFKYALGLAKDAIGNDGSSNQIDSVTLS